MIRAEIFQIDPVGYFENKSQQDIFNACGLIPQWFYEYWISPSSQSLYDYLNDVYRHGGGFVSINGFRLNGKLLSYAGDPMLYPLLEINLPDYTCFFYPGSWLAIVDKEGGFKVARFD